MKLRMYTVPETGNTNGKIVFTGEELVHLFGKLPTEDKEFRVKMGMSDSGVLVLSNFISDQKISRNVIPWLHPYGKDDWSVSLTEHVRSQLSLQAYCKGKGEGREAFVPVRTLMDSDGTVKAFVSRLIEDGPTQPTVPTPMEQAVAAVRLLNRFAVDNPGRVNFALQDNQLQMWTGMVA